MSAAPSLARSVGRATGRARLQGADPLSRGEWIALLVVVPISMLVAASFYRVILLFWVPGADGVNAALGLSTVLHLALLVRTASLQMTLLSRERRTLDQAPWLVR